MLKIWVTFLATGLKRGASISKKLNHETSSVSLATGQRGVGFFALGEVHNYEGRGGLGGHIGSFNEREKRDLCETQTNSTVLTPSV